MGGGSTTVDTQSQGVSQTQLPPWVNQAAQQNYALAQNTAERPYTAFQGQQVADIGPSTQQAWNTAAQSGAAGQDQYNAAQAGYLTAAGYQPNQVQAGSVTPGQLSSTNLNAYMNPFTSSVINATLPIMQQGLALSQNQQADQAASAGAFGGSRQAVQAGVTQAQGAMQQAQLAAQLNQANYAQAQQAAEYDIGQNMQGQEFNAGQSMQAQTANQGANQAAINSLLAASGGLGALGTQAQTNQRQQFLEQSTAGAQQQQQAQNQINAQMNAFNQANMYPTQQLGILQSALGMTPYGSATTNAQSGQQTTQTNPSIASDIFGGLQSLGGMFGAGGPFGAGGAGAALFSSDRHLKTDIQKVGTHPATGLPLYSYRYKGDPKTFPKVTGPMAEDAMQVMPAAVHTVGVHGPTGQALHTVDMGALNAGSPNANDNLMGAPVLRPHRMPGANGAFATRVPGALAPTAPMGVTGALGASMRAPRMRRKGPPVPQVAGGLSG